MWKKSTLNFAVLSLKCESRDRRAEAASETLSWDSKQSGFYLISPASFLSRHLNPQSTFNVCLQSIMDVYFVYCWFAKSLFCVVDSGMFTKNICLCSNQRLFTSGFFFVCLSLQLFLLFFLPLWNLVLDELTLLMVCLLENVQ